jgi:hypothetical protein
MVKQLEYSINVAIRRHNYVVTRLSAPRTPQSRKNSNPPKIEPEASELKMYRISLRA